MESSSVKMRAFLCGVSRLIALNYKMADNLYPLSFFEKMPSLIIIDSDKPSIFYSIV